MKRVHRLAFNYNLMKEKLLKEFANQVHTLLCALTDQWGPMCDTSSRTDKNMDSKLLCKALRNIPVSSLAALGLHT